MDSIPRTYKPKPKLLSSLASLPWYVRYASDSLGTMLRGIDRFGPAFSLSRPSLRGKNHKHIFAIGPEYNRQILSDPTTFRAASMAPKGVAGSAMDRIRNGFQPTAGAGSQALRRMTLAPFSKRAVQGYHHEIVSVADESFAEWPLEKPIDIAEHLRQYALTLSNRLLFGAESPERVRLLGELLDDFVRGAYFSSAVLLPFHYPGSPYTRLNRTCEKLAELLDAMVTDRRTRPTGERDILGMLVQGQSPGSEIDLFGPMTFLFIASFETLATALTWTLFLLAQHPLIAANVVDELQATLDGEAPDTAQLDQLPMLDAVIQESLRLLPPIPILFRRATRNGEEVAGIPVNGGDWVFLSQYATHRLPELYERPQQFRPERWSTICPGTYEYFPWGAGPRSCIGFALGMTALKVSLAMALQKFRFAVAPNARIDRVVKVTVNPRHGLPMILHRPDGCFESNSVRGQICEMVDLPAPHRASNFRSRSIPRSLFARPTRVAA